MHPQILAAALTHCHRLSSEEGAPLRLKVFIAGRNRLENDGATALAHAFQVWNAPRPPPPPTLFALCRVFRLSEDEDVDHLAEAFAAEAPVQKAKQDWSMEWGGG